jgi:hypothetical protein
VRTSCGEFLDNCPAHHPIRAQREVDVAHRQAVARARRSGFASQPRPGWLFTLLDPTAIHWPAEERAA